MCVSCVAESAACCSIMQLNPPTHHVLIGRAQTKLCLLLCCAVLYGVLQAEL